MKVLTEKLLKWNYYFFKIPLYLRESSLNDENQEGLCGHMKMFFDILVNSNEEGSKILESFNITDPNYFTNLNLDGVTANGTEFELLDNLAKLYGLSRNLKFGVYDLTFTNKQLIQLLEIKIFQINWQGTRDEYLKLYESINLPITFYIDRTIPGKIITIADTTNMENNMKILYEETNMLFIDILGIEYERGDDLDFTDVATFDDSVFEGSEHFL